MAEELPKDEPEEETKTLEQRIEEAKASGMTAEEMVEIEEEKLFGKKKKSKKTKEQKKAEKAAEEQKQPESDLQ